MSHCADVSRSVWTDKLLIAENLSRHARKNTLLSVPVSQWCTAIVNKHDIRHADFLIQDSCFDPLCYIFLCVCTTWLWLTKCHIFTSEWWTQKAAYGSMGIFINKGAISWLPTVCKSPAFWGTGPSRGGAATDAVNDSDFLEHNPLANLNKGPQRGAEERNPPLMLTPLLTHPSLAEDCTFVWAGAALC